MAAAKREDKAENKAGKDGESGKADFGNEAKQSPGDAEAGLVEASRRQLVQEMRKKFQQGNATQEK